MCPNFPDHLSTHPFVDVHSFFRFQRQIDAKLIYFFSCLHLHVSCGSVQFIGTLPLNYTFLMNLQFFCHEENPSMIFETSIKFGSNVGNFKVDRTVHSNTTLKCNVSDHPEKFEWKRIQFFDSDNKYVICMHATLVGYTCNKNCSIIHGAFINSRKLLLYNYHRIFSLILRNQSLME